MTEYSPIPNGVCGGPRALTLTSSLIRASRPIWATTLATGFTYPCQYSLSLSYLATEIKQTKVYYPLNRGPAISSFDIKVYLGEVLAKVVLRTSTETLEAYKFLRVVFKGLNGFVVSNKSAPKEVACIDHEKKDLRERGVVEPSAISRSVEPVLYHEKEGARPRYRVIF